MLDQSALKRAILKHNLPLERPRVDSIHGNTVVLNSGNEVFDAAFEQHRSVVDALQTRECALPGSLLQLDD